MIPSAGFDLPVVFISFSDCKKTSLYQKTVSRSVF